ncbi:uncharacterized protein LOC141613746 [Silene latifolia]|uniref:uncharacterized protein LOC141613746 n=1 Tax=Silene latifolia TaxID=37657 RepID=UPI003D776A1F
MEVLKNLQVSLPFTELVTQVPAHAKFLKEIFSKKQSFDEVETVAFTQECAATLQANSPPKLQDPGSFSIPCHIGIIAMANRSLKRPIGVLEDVPGRVGKNQSDAPDAASGPWSKEVDEIEKLIYGDYPCKSKSPHVARKINLSLTPLDLDVIPEDIEEEEEEAPENVAVPQKSRLQLTPADVEGEITYWSSAVYCYILGANPPPSVISGYVKRIWQSYGIDRISFLPNGIFLVRFKTKEKQMEVVNNGHLIFDNKPVIVKEWTPDSELIKHDVKLIPIWMKLHGLDIKFWGTECLRKICGLVGKMMRCDEATSHRTFLGYARIMVEVQIGQQFPTHLEFLDEVGKTQRVSVVYDWLPLSCTKCKGMGHIAVNCRKVEGGQRKVWKPKAKPATTKVVKPIQKTFQKPVSPAVTTPVAQHSTQMQQDSGVQTLVPVTPVVVSEVGDCSDQSVRPVEGGPSFPRRFISKMLRNVNGEARVFTPRGLTFMDALTLSLQKARIEGKKLLTPGPASDHGQEREPLWQALKGFSALIYGPWLVCGDFNSVTETKDRIGGSEVVWSEMAPMRSMLSVCHLYDMKASGSYYTWNNKHENESKVYSRIDRVLMNDQWLNTFPEAVATFLPEGLYDHCPCLIRTDAMYVKRKASFKYYNMWALSDDFVPIVESSWNTEVEGTPMFRVQQLSLDPLNELLCHAEKECATELKVLNKARNSYLAQKSKENWVKEGDANTSFFHSSIKKRRMRNRVFNVKDMEGKLCSTPEDIKSAFEDYYLKLLGTSTTVQPVSKKVVKTSKLLNAVHQDILLKPVTDGEVKEAMFSIPGGKAPGPDGFNSQFFKDSWSIVGKEVCHAIRNVFRTGKVLKELNTTVLTLVPKTEIPDSVLQFRPIACCNTVYKCLTKVLCSRLSSILPDIISPSQGAFIQNRDIVGNILICQDLIKLYKRKVCSPRIMMKVDLQKAYDSIEWSFLKDMLCALNFPPLSIELIMSCVSSPSFSLALNGEVFGFFKGQRGLRQGDPLSPLLFTICLEYLSRLLGVLDRYKGFKYHPLCSKMKLTHLCFADDLLMFSRGDIQSVTLMLRAFETFSISSGLKMNNGKSNFYTNGISEAIVSSIESASGMKRGGIPFRYLGVKIAPKRLGILDCQSLVDKVTARITSLGTKHLSYAGRITLIKSVLSNLHNYWARIFILPKAVLNQIDALCRAFLWHGQENKETPTLVSWKQVCKPRRKGGLGLKNLQLWNIALMGKYVRICAVKNQLKPWIFEEQWRQSNCDYTVKMGYNWLVDDGVDVRWHHWTRNRLIVPKHAFFIWLVAHKRLLTQDRLMKMMIAARNRCLLCDTEEESIEHLFFQCSYSQRCLRLLEEWLQVSIPLNSIIDWWIRLRERSLLKKQVVAAAVAHLMYLIWYARNRCMLLYGLPFPVVLIKQVKECLLMNLRGRTLVIGTNVTREWLANVCPNCI